MFLTQPLDDFETVQAWSEALKVQWGGNPLEEDPEKRAALEAFCEYMGKTPDELCEFCFLRKRDTGVRFASKKRREELTGKVFQFVLESGSIGVEKRRLRSNVYSFFTHNGVLI